MYQLQLGSFLEYPAKVGTLNKIRGRRAGEENNYEKFDTTFGLGIRRTLSFLFLDRSGNGAGHSYRARGRGTNASGASGILFPGFERADADA